MFTGIVSHVGEVKAIELSDTYARLKIESELFQDNVKLGDSISVSGVCLSVVELGQNQASFDLASETLRATSLSKIEVGNKCNLELALKYGDRLDGHLVQGHVDCVVEIKDIQKEDNTYRFELSMPKSIAKFIAPKGSVTLDGISLTVGELSNLSFSVYIIPHTFINTTIGQRKQGDILNLEIDCLARYVSRILECKNEN